MGNVGWFIYLFIFYYTKFIVPISSLIPSAPPSMCLRFLSVDALVNPALRSIPVVNREVPGAKALPLFLCLSIIPRPLIFQRPLECRHAYSLTQSQKPVQV